jgi:hypothetical protein
MIDPTDFLHPSPAPHLKNFPGISDLLPKCPSFSTVQICAAGVALTGFLDNL